VTREGERIVEDENLERRIKPLGGERIVIGSGGVTFLDVLYIIKDVHGWISLVKTILHIFLHVKKLADSCLVLYQSDDIWLAGRGNGIFEPFEHFSVLILPPKFFLDCRRANKVVSLCKEIGRRRAQELINSDPDFADILLYDLQNLEIMKVRELYHPKKLLRALKWYTMRRKLRYWKIGAINVYDWMTRNWRKIEELINPYLGNSMELSP
jgi:hypothetical protein